MEKPADGKAHAKRLETKLKQARKKCEDLQKKIVVLEAECRDLKKKIAHPNKGEVNVTAYSQLVLENSQLKRQLQIERSKKAHQDLHHGNTITLYHGRL